MTRNRRHSRRGFSLLEILIVIGIILLLMTISVTVVSNLLVTTKTNATEATLRKVSEVLNQRIEAFGRWMDKQGYFDENSLKASGAWQEAVLAGGDEQLAKVLQRKKFFADHFPQLFSEQDAIPTPGSSHLAVTESAEALYWTVTRGETFGEESVDIDFFNSNEIQDTDNDGLLEFVDAWGNPLRYYRWPTRLIRPATAGNEGTAAKNVVDSESAARILLGSVRTAPVWLDSHVYSVGDVIIPSNIEQNDRIYRCTVAGTSAATESSPWPSVVVGEQFAEGPDTLEWEVVFDPLAQDGDDKLGAASNYSVAEFETNYHTRDTYHVPLIVSAGEDGTVNPGLALGLYEPHDTANFGNLAQPILGSSQYLLDNITNQNLRAGGN